MAVHHGASFGGGGLTWEDVERRIKPAVLCLQHMLLWKLALLALYAVA